MGCSRGSTTALKRHLEAKHVGEAQKLAQAEVERTQSQPAATTTYNNNKKRRLDQPSLEEVVERTQKVSTNSTQQLEFNTLMVDFMACTGSSFNIVEVNIIFNIKYNFEKNCYFFSV